MINFAIIISSSFILQIIKLIFSIYISNQVSSEAMGVFQLIMTVYMFGITLASAGINITCMKIVSEEIALKNYKSAKKTSIKCTLIGLIAGTLSGILFCLNSEFITVHCLHNKVRENVIYLIAIALPLISMSAAISGYFMAIRKVKKNVVGNFIEQISKVISTCIILKYFCDVSSINNICFALILGDVISEIISFIYFSFAYIYDLVGNRKINTTYINNVKNKITNNTFKFRLNSKILNILIPIALTSYIRSGISTLKQLIIPSSLERSGINCEKALSDYGIISAMALPIVMFPSIFLGIFANLLIPEFSRYYATKDYYKIKKYTHKLIMITLLFSCFVSFIFWNWGQEIGLLIYNNAYVGNYIKIFSIIIPFMYVDIIIDSILKGIDEQVFVMKINIIDLAISTFLIIFIVPILGIKGYILSIFISEIFNLILSLRKLLKFYFLQIGTVLF